MTRSHRPHRSSALCSLFALAVSSTVAACGSDFNDCQAARSCPVPDAGDPAGGAPAAALDAGAEAGVGGAGNSDETGGQAAREDAGGAGGAGDEASSPAGGEPAGESTLGEAVTCGDGKPQAPEQCDDGNSRSGDGCSKTCQWEAVDLAFGPAALTCAFSSNGSTECWGPAQVERVFYGLSWGTGAKVRQLAAGSTHQCALLEGGQVKCWGQNQYGQLGYGDKLDRNINTNFAGDALPSVDLGAGRTAKAIAAGTHHTCAVLDVGGVRCWGSGASGQLYFFRDSSNSNLGDDAGEVGDNLPLIPASAAHLAAGDDYTCALLLDGRVSCWGGYPLSASQPVQFGAGLKAEALSGGARHACAVLSDGTLRCWGANAGGELGLGHTNAVTARTGSPLPAVALGQGRTVKTVAAGDRFTCALLDNGAVKCWGTNGQGQLGLGDRTSRGGAPNEMGDALPALSFGSGRTAERLFAGRAQACALFDDGALKCWGTAFAGAAAAALGDVPVPIEVRF